MKLIDFHNDDELNQLRKIMNDAELGEFELFDPIRHLTWQERKQLEQDWIKAPAQHLHAYHDKSLAYKNSPVLTASEEHYHFALCDKLTQRIRQGRLVEANVTLNLNLIEGKGVCEYCLHAVSFQGFDAYRHRHHEYNEKIIKDFDLKTYLKSKGGYIP